MYIIIKYFLINQKYLTLIILIILLLFPFQTFIVNLNIWLSVFE